MNDLTEVPGDREGSPRGEAAWRAAKASVAARNAEARKAGKRQREAHDLQAAQDRAAADRLEMADLARKSGERLASS